METLTPSNKKLDINEVFQFKKCFCLQNKVFDIPCRRNTFIWQQKTLGVDPVQVCGCCKYKFHVRVKKEENSPFYIMVLYKNTEQIHVEYLYADPNEQFGEMIDWWVKNKLNLSEEAKIKELSYKENLK